MVSCCADLRPYTRRLSRGDAEEARAWLCERLREGAAEEERGMDEAVSSRGDGAGAEDATVPLAPTRTTCPRSRSVCLRGASLSPRVTPRRISSSLTAALAEDARKARAKAVARSLFRFGAAQSLRADLGAYSKCAAAQPRATSLPVHCAVTRPRRVRCSSQLLAHSPAGCRSETRRRAQRLCSASRAPRSS